MITFNDVIKKANIHPVIDSGKQAIFETPDLKVSIVGGGRGLYGDFIEDFEVAIIDTKTGDFVSGKYFPEYSDDGQIMPYISKEQMLEVVNKIMLV